jgi:serine phosphatase RsbU (regulator of sigma subunit)
MTLSVSKSEEVRAAQLFDERFAANARRVDRLFTYLLLLQWGFGVLLSVTLSPYAWQGKTQVLHAHVLIATVLGGLVTSVPVILGFTRPGWVGTRMVIAVAQMVWSALLIHLTGGRIETHFHVFGSLAFVSFYRDWRVLVPATVVVATDHLMRQVLWPESVFGILAPESWRFLEHAGWVVFEDVFLVLACVGGVKEMRDLAAHQVHSELTDRLEQEMQIASSIQTSILPRQLEVPGLEVSAQMLPATEVGGDYYELLEVPGGCWIAIGDVAGHGLKAGLVMLQAQSATEALIRQSPNGQPAQILCEVNRVLYENVRNRLRSEEHMTMSLMRYFDDGRLVTAGAHEEMIIWRAESGRCEVIPVRGTWLGAMEAIDHATTETTLQLSEGDLLVLYTDGVIEARTPGGEQFGLERLCSIVEEAASERTASIRDRVMAAVVDWEQGHQHDDVTVMVLRHRAIVERAA